MLPQWTGKLDFRLAESNEAGCLKTLYERAWGNGITISEQQIQAMIRNFPEGQIVGVEKGKNEPVSMINIMLMVLRRGESFQGGYEQVTGDRTFSTSLNPLDLLEILDNEGANALGIASCVSVATHPAYARFGYAHETLNYSIMFSLVNHLIPCPYSAPRGFAKARRTNPNLSIQDYLHMTRPTRRNYSSYWAKAEPIIPRLRPAFGEHVLSGYLFEKYQHLAHDPPKLGAAAFKKFMQEDAQEFHNEYGRTPTIEDFCIQTGRVLLDPVIGLHVSNGARFIRDQNGEITAIFEDSRPEDSASLGYNIVLSYVYHNILGHSFMTKKQDFCQH
jgi:hypothetical protein